MSPRSSRGGGGGGAAAGDILDLDRYMTSRPPPDPDTCTTVTCQRLIVDAGGGAPRALSVSDTASYPSLASGRRTPPPPERRDRHDRHARRATDKRASHDSGVSDDSSLKRPRSKRKTLESANFSTCGNQCERALREQKAQLTRLANICERLASERRDTRDTPRHERHDRHASSTSDLSSSSTGSDDKRRNLKNEYKSYKLIMSKLDELNRAMSRRRAAAAGGGRPAASRAAPGATAARVVVVERAVGADSAASDTHDAGRKHTRTLLKCSSQFTESSSRCNFDLENPIKLYEQAKRLQAVTAVPATTRRAHSADCSPRTQARLLAECQQAHQRVYPERPRTFRERPSPTLCSLCRGYWKAVKRCLVSQLMAKVDLDE